MGEFARNARIWIKSRDPLKKAPTGFRPASATPSRVVQSKIDKITNDALSYINHNHPLDSDDEVWNARVEAHAPPGAGCTHYFVFCQDEYGQYRYSSVPFDPKSPQTISENDLVEAIAADEEKPFRAIRYFTAYKEKLTWYHGREIHVGYGKNKVPFLRTNPTPPPAGDSVPDNFSDIAKCPPLTNSMDIFLNQK